MPTLEEIRELLKKYTAGEVQTFPASVVSHGENYTCEVKPVGSPEMQVRLKASEDDSKGGFVLWPVIGSNVLIAIINEDPHSGYICAMDEVNEVEMRCDKVTFNEGLNGGLIIHEQLLSQYNKTKEVVDAIVDTLLNWAPVTSDGGAALKTAIDLAMEGKQTGDLSDITNEKIKH